MVNHFKKYFRRRQCKFSICVIFISVLQPFVFQGAAQNADTLQTAMNRLLIEQHITGAIWTLVTDGGTIHVDCAGLANKDVKQPLSTSSKVQIGSITKTILAMGILRLATEGKIDIDDPVKKYLPDVPFINVWDSTMPVTIRHLLDHTSGLSDLRIWHLFSTSATPQNALADFYTKEPDVLRVHTKPGTMFSYSNMGYTLLGMIVESATGQRYETYLDKHLLQPLGMLNSTFEFVSQTGPAADAKLAMGHLDNGETFPAVPMYLRPAGQFTTTAYDMGLFMKFLMGSGEIRGQKFVDRKYLLQLGKPHHTIAAQRGLESGYALGASIRDRHGVAAIAHGGNVAGYRAMLYVFPKEQKAFFISHNMDSETADYEVFIKTLITSLKIPPVQADKHVERTAGLEEWDGYYIPVITKVEPFGLLDKLGSFTKVTLQDSGATFSPFQKEAQYLHYLGAGVFRAGNKVNASHAFYRQGDKLCITTGLSTIRKTSGILILAIALSFCTGLIGIVYVFCAGVLACIRKERVWQRPIFWSFGAVVLVLAAIPFVVNQSFLNFGDRTIGNVLLTIGTGLLPLTTLISWVLHIRATDYAVNNIRFWAFASILQFCVLLALNGMLPFILWR